LLQALRQRLQHRLRLGGFILLAQHVVEVFPRRRILRLVVNSERSVCSAWGKSLLCRSTSARNSFAEAPRAPLCCASGAESASAWLILPCL
jgi:hypothetical protein